VIDAQTRDLLQDIVRRESRSVLTYVGDAYPWTTARDSRAADALRKLIAEEAGAVAGLGRFLFRRHMPVVSLGSYPSSFTTMNFVALEYLLPRLIDYERRSIADLERDLVGVRDPEARAEVEKLLAVKRRNLPVLESLAVGQPKAEEVVT
jgi:hypothetical protein